MTFMETITALTALASLGMVSVAHAEGRIEQPGYQVVKSVDGVELREYAPYIVAETIVEAPSRDAASSLGFRALAGYIFGGNTARDEIAMTAPVTTQASDNGTQIAMTAPVTTEGTREGRYTIRFSMPSKWTMETLPIPNNPNVILKEVPSETRLAYRFVGTRSADKVAEAEQKIERVAGSEDIALSSPPIVAGYDGPRTPPSKRRWEVMRVVASQ